MKPYHVLSVPNMTLARFTHGVLCCCSLCASTGIVKHSSYKKKNLLRIYPFVLEGPHIPGYAKKTEFPKVVQLLARVYFSEKMCINRLKSTGW